MHQPARRQLVIRPYEAVIHPLFSRAASFAGVMLLVRWRAASSKEVFDTTSRTDLHAPPRSYTWNQSYSGQRTLEAAADPQHQLQNVPNCALSCVTMNPVGLLQQSFVSVVPSESTVLLKTGHLPLATPRWPLLFPIVLRHAVSLLTSSHHIAPLLRSSAGIGSVRLLSSLNLPNINIHPPSLHFDQHSATQAPATPALRVLTNGKS